MRYGFIGLGHMGAPICANLAKAGYRPLTYDIAGSAERSPPDSEPVATIDEVFGADTVFVCVPDGRAALAIADARLQRPHATTQTIIDLSTTGIAAATEASARLAHGSVDYIDSPVSGGVAGARRASMTLIWSGSAAQLARHEPALKAISGNIFHVGERAGQGQAMKLLNNFLSATAMAASSEAMAFGLKHGLDLKTMLDVVNVSTGRNTATSDKFPNRILTETFDAGFFTALMRKDVDLYMESVHDTHSASTIGHAVRTIWRDFHSEEPSSDITELFPWIEKTGEQRS